MPIKGRLWGAKYGPDWDTSFMVLTGGNSSYAMGPLNTGWCGRFIATQAKAIKSVRVSWAAITSAGQVQVRIETVDATTGKPTGTLYDANASITAAPAAGTQTFTFASLPTTNMTVGNAYAVVILTTTGGTTHTLRSHSFSGGATTALPICALQAADGTTRSNFAEVAGATPQCSLVLGDDSEDSMGMLPFSAAPTSNFLINDDATALKFVTDVTLAVAGVEFVPTKVGTPTSDIRIQILDASNNVISGATVTVDKDFLVGQASNKRCLALFGSVISLAPGTYRAVFDASSDTTSSNCWNLRSQPPLSTASTSSGFSTSTAPAIATPVWTDTTDVLGVALVLDDVTAPANGGGARVIGG